MKIYRISVFLGFFAFFISTNNSSSKNNTSININIIKNLEAKGIRVHRPIYDIKIPALPDSNNTEDKNELLKLSVSKNIPDAKQRAIRPKISSLHKALNATSTAYDTIMIEDFETGEIDTNKWELTGDPTWGITEDRKQSGQYSIWCATGGDSAVSTKNGYPNNMNSKIIFGPFDLSDVNYAKLTFMHFIDTEGEKDWFSCFASVDGLNFHGISISGQEGFFGVWAEEVLNLNNVYGFGNMTGEKQVWIAFIFESDSISTSDKGVFIDDIILTKKQVAGTPVAGFVSGTWKSDSNPYIVMSNIGVAEDEVLSIKSGVEVKFEKETGLVVYGILLAQGTDSDSITFTSNEVYPNSGDWSSIYCTSDASYPSVIQFSIIEFAGYENDQFNAGIISWNVSLENNLITSNKGSGIFCRGNINISENHITGNDNGIRVYQASPQIIKNTIMNNGSGVSLGFSGATLKENIIIDNSGDGISSSISDPIITNNVIKQNGADGISAGGSILVRSPIIVIENQINDNNGNGITLLGLARIGNISNNLIKGNIKSGIDFSEIGGMDEGIDIDIINNTIVSNTKSGIYCGSKEFFHSRIINNIIVDNLESGIYCNNSLKFNISYNNVFNNNPNFILSQLDSIGIQVNTNFNNDSCDIYFNISEEPCFSTQSNDYSLQDISPCKNSGNPNVFFYDSDGTINDLGFSGGTLLNINFPEYYFGDVLLEDFITINLKIENFRDERIIIKKIFLSDSINFSFSQDDKIIIWPYDTKNIEITFNPHIVGDCISTLSVISDAFISSNNADIYLQGKGINGTLVNGAVNGIWKKSESPYALTGTINIPKGEELKIEPGVEVIFNGNYSISVVGKFEAIGTETDSILFTRKKNFKDYDGRSYLSFNAIDDTVKLNYCIIENMPEFDNIFKIETYAIRARNTAGFILQNSRISNNNRNAVSIREGSSYVVLTDCNISNNKGDALQIGNSNVKLSNCIIRNNDGVGLSCGNCSGVIINNIIQRNNDGGISFMKNNVEFSNNIVLENSGRLYGGMLCRNDTLLFTNNIIYNNYAIGGVPYVLPTTGGFLIQGCNLIALNNIIRNNRIGSNKSQINFGNEAGIAILNYNDIEGGISGVDNIDEDPLFINPQYNNFHLQPNSPCIDAGCDSLQYDDPEDLDNPGFALYPALGTISNDMGTYGGPGAANWPDNHTPQPFSLLLPTNSDTITTLTPTFKWEAATDPDFGDQVRYALFYTINAEFDSIPNVKDLLTRTYTIEDTLVPETTYYWKVLAYDNDSLITECHELFYFSTPVLTDIVQLNNNLPKKYKLSQNYPNPFNPFTTVKYQLPYDCHVVLTIYNMLGQKLVTLLDNDQQAGYFDIKWDATSFASGLYFYHLKAIRKNNKSFNKINKMMLLK